MRTPRLWTKLSQQATEGVLGMNPKLRFLIAVSVCALTSAAVVATAQAARKDDKVWICHGTASETNPYVLIRVDAHALEGHFDGTAPGHGKNNHPDLVLVDGVCGGTDEIGGDTEEVGGGSE
jgi:hypothetical protein